MHAPGDGVARLRLKVGHGVVGAGGVHLGHQRGVLLRGGDQRIAGAARLEKRHHTLRLHARAAAIRRVRRVEAGADLDLQAALVGDQQHEHAVALVAIAQAPRVEEARRLLLGAGGIRGERLRCKKKDEDERTRRGAVRASACRARSVRGRSLPAGRTSCRGASTARAEGGWPREPGARRTLGRHDGNVRAGARAQLGADGGDRGALLGRERARAVHDRRRPLRQLRHCVGRALRGGRASVGRPARIGGVRGVSQRRQRGPHVIRF